MKTKKAPFIAKVLICVLATCLMMSMVIGCQKEVKPMDLNNSDV